MSRNVLVLNCGSSSIKYQLIDADSGAAHATGLVEKIGSVDGVVTHREGAESARIEGAIADHAVGLTLMRQAFADAGEDLNDRGVIAVGHRVVHGGTTFTGPVLIDDTVVAEIGELSVLAPLHNPANLVGIERAMANFPHLPHVAVFDTAFFADLPPAASTYAIDRALADRHGVRRYGFHGTSHSYVSQEVASFLDRPYGELNQIVLHLGAGASVTAIRGGRPVDTSMGMTPLQGLVMATRSGDIDPGALFHLHRVAGLSVDEIDTLLNRRSGVQGLSGVSDFRDLHRLIAAGDAHAQLALDVWVHRVRAYLGAYYVLLGSVDVITFTAGVGENDARARELVTADLEGLGIAVDAARNTAPSREARVISPDGSRVTVMVMPTNEELAIARATVASID
ncbi:acetate kinase [Nakamurella deserti]|uniref:acetate kinase n=1 Tax=Nakamurella deserti TaxID=2164074 RepID=UPI000DBE090D|nr:acetate kinase [Nakamurella deserti]